MLAGCSSLPKIRVAWPVSEKTAEIEKLKLEKDQLAAESEAKIAAAKLEVSASEATRYGKGSAYVYAASDTLRADPAPTKYVGAAEKSLVVAKEALPVPDINALLLANKIQADLLSEQAERIAAAEKELGTARTEIVAAKSKEEELKAAQDKWRAETAAKEKELADQIQAKQDQLEKERLEWASKAEQDAAKYRYDQVWYRRLNPLTHLGKLFSSLGVWLIVFVVIGGGLKLASLFFPGSGIIGSIVNGAGKAIGGVVGMFARWIPNALEGAGAVDKKQHELVVKVADNSIGSIQNFREAAPDKYEDLKRYLNDWNRDATPEQKAYIEQRLKDLNQV